MTIGEQSVSAIMPKLRLGVSGPSPPPPVVTAFDSALESQPPSAPPSSAAAPARPVALSIFLREIFDIGFSEFIIPFKRATARASSPAAHRTFGLRAATSADTHPLDKRSAMTR